jgi:hypothetical protein
MAFVDQSVSAALQGAGIENRQQLTACTEPGPHVAAAPVAKTKTASLTNRQGRSGDQGTSAEALGLIQVLTAVTKGESTISEQYLGGSMLHLILVNLHSCKMPN